MRLVDILPVENIKIPLTAKTKDEIITELVDLAADSNPLINRDIVLESIFEREKTMSTGIGSGIAIPHGKSNGVKDIIAAFGTIPGGAEFESLDEKPVHLFFLIASPLGPATLHLRCLSRLSRLLNKEKFRQDLLAADTSTDARRIIEDAEQEFFEMD